MQVTGSNQYGHSSPRTLLVAHIFMTQMTLGIGAIRERLLAWPGTRPRQASHDLR